jgi:general secretion pathway protein D
MSAVRFILFMATVAMLQCCSSSEQLAGIGPGDSVDSIRTADLAAQFAAPAAGTSLSRQAARPMLFPGSSGGHRITAEPLQQPPASGVTTRGDGVEINFDQADVQTVAKALLGETLGMNFIVDPRVLTPITIVSAAPIARKDVLPAFESALRLSNAAIVRDHDIVRIMPANDAGGTGPATFGAAQPGFGVTIAPLRYASAAAIVKTAENFLVRPGAIRADTARNFVLIQGSTNERRAALEMIAGFDVEWMRNQSVGVYPLKASSPDAVIRELDQIFGTAEGAQGAGTVTFQPISRMNAVMAVARSPATLERVTQWVRRLDRSDTSGTTVRVYRLENGNAAKIVKILNDIFVGKGSGTASDSASSQIAPGVAAGQSKLDALSSSSSFGNSNSSGSQRSTAAGGGSGDGQISGAFATFSEKKDADAEAKSENALGGNLPRGVFQNVRITADSSNNSIIVFSNQDDYRVIERSLRELDRPQLQVSIEATVAEVSLTDDLQYGVQYYLGSRSKGNASLANATTAAASSSSSSSSSTSSTSTSDTVGQLLLQRTLPGFNLVLGSEARPHVILNALSTLTSVKVLSAPSLVVTDNQPALLQVGQEIPVSTGSATVLSTSNTVVNTIQMRDTGVILKVWPHVHANGTIQLEVEQEISNAIDTSLTPTISQRRVHSTVSVTSGQTVMLGGMISEQDVKTLDGLPGLRRIAYLGDLFGNTDKSKNRQEIIVFIKPQIIRDSFDAQGVAEEFRSRLETMRSIPAIASAPIQSPRHLVRK